MDLNVHLVFPGTCEKAFNTYREVLNGEIVFLFRKGEDESIKVPDDEKDEISHMVLSTETFSLWGQDAERGDEVITGSSKLVLVFRKLEELRQVFHQLYQGGTVVSPLQKTFFSESMGELIDRYGVRWLIMMTDEDYERPD